MTVLDLQRRGQQIGRIRIGEQVPTGETHKDGTPKMRPVKLATFRFTTASRVAADAIAALYGGEVRTWRGQFEVITSQSEIGVTVPPRDAVISQRYEMWNKGGCVRRCDSQSDQISGGPCKCPHADNPGDEQAVAEAALRRADMAKRNPPQACKLVTRISVMIPDLPGLGVFRLDSGSYYAATEIGDAAMLMQAARDRGVMLPAILRIDQRQRVAGGRTTSYPVPVLEVLATFRQIASGQLEAGGITAQLPPPPGEPPKAITAGPASPEATPGPLADDPEEAKQKRAQEIAEEIASAGITAPRFRALGAEARENGLMGLYVCTDRKADHWQELEDRMTARWEELSRKAGAA